MLSDFRIIGRMMDRMMVYMEFLKVIILFIMFMCFLKQCLRMIRDGEYMNLLLIFNNMLQVRYRSFSFVMKVLDMSFMVFKVVLKNVVGLMLIWLLFMLVKMQIKKVMLVQIDFIYVVKKMRKIIDIICILILKYKRL